MSNLNLAVQVQVKCRGGMKYRCRRTDGRMGRRRRPIQYTCNFSKAYRDNDHIHSQCNGTHTIWVFLESSQKANLVFKHFNNIIDMLIRSIWYLVKRIEVYVFCQVSGQDRQLIHLSTLEIESKIEIVCSRLSHPIVRPILSVDES